MTQQEQDTLSGTIRCRVDRAKSGNIKLVPDPEGPWKILKGPPVSRLVRYFEPAYQIGVDEFGNKK